MRFRTSSEVEIKLPQFVSDSIFLKLNELYDLYEEMLKRSGGVVELSLIHI